jgi:uncharacterized protein
LILGIFENLPQIVFNGGGKKAKTTSPPLQTKKIKPTGFKQGYKVMGQSKPFGFDGSELNFLELGINYACGRKVEADLIEAHKWFNIAALRGDVEAARRRQEIAAEMSSFDIAHAQRRAREWMVAH